MSDKMRKRMYLYALDVCAVVRSSLLATSAGTMNRKVLGICQ